MNNSKRSQKLLEIYRRLFGLYGEVECPLRHDGAFQLLVAVVLSAQTTDVRVNMVTEELFRKFGDVERFAAASPEEVGEIIRSVGLYRSKSVNLCATAKKLRDEFNGTVPHTMEELTSLPGVGRKSANVILGNAFGIPGFPADTHVQRLLMRLGIINNRDPEVAEATVCGSLPAEYWTNFSHLLIQHGRNICFARTPKCAECVLKELCPSAEEE